MFLKPQIPVRRPAVGRKDRGRFISGKNKQNAVKAMVFTDGDGRLLFRSPPKPGSCADITHARTLGLVKLLTDGPAVEILADAGYQGLGAQTGGRVVTPPAPQVQEECPGPVRGDAGAPAQGALLTPHPGRTRRRPPEELAGTAPSPRPPRAYERHRPSHCPITVPAIDRRPDPGLADVCITAPAGTATSHR
ncbi:transposase family protein [Streptomyces sp. ME01-18a]|uniref:transposase family protein n=1 Tax=Streptomyces sp. ME01-18a TaxID=3028669 RepID=UPI0029A0392B|nr:transposase family protein [Streptomyces sp. ME01-18a]MDX3434334.1 transposase family protein [Streptomyces sp. ME01-18a]